MALKFSKEIVAIQSFCRQCLGNSIKNIRDCPSRKCPFFPFRFGYSFPLEMEQAAIEKIFSYCLSCVGTGSEIIHCSDSNCALYHLRLDAVKHHFPKIFPTFYQTDLFSNHKP